MNAEALFLNGVFENVLREILLVQSDLPNLTLFLQPHKGERIVKLAENPPSNESPVRIFISTTTDLSSVCYLAEIIGWDDKRELPEAKKRVLNRVIWTLQPNEGGLYDRAKPDGPKCVNLLHIRGLKALAKPFPVSELVKTIDGEPLLEGRTTSGGWAYVYDRSDAWLCTKI